MPRKVRWLTLLLTVPPTPIRHRVGFWRKLKRMGAVPVRGSAWMLPDTPETAELFGWLAQEVQSVRGQAMLLHVDRVEATSEEDLRAAFQRARAADYEPIVRGCRQLAAELDRQRSAHGSLEPLRSKLETLKRELDRVQSVDYIQSPAGGRAQDLWERLAARTRALEDRPAARGGRRAPGPPSGSVWVTRPRPHIDRVASAWLIRRFIDAEARFAFAEPPDAPKKGIPFDILGAEYGHQGEDCTFETLIKRFRVKDARVRALAEIVHEADLRDGKFPRPEAAGIDLILKGLAATTQDDHELLERGMAVLDGLYATLKPRG